jgi:hypothetical protein
MNKDIVDLVESLNGTVLFDGALIQFTDVTFMAALKKIYESGALEEREACAKVCEDSVEYAGDELAIQIRARGKA